MRLPHGRTEIGDAGERGYFRQRDLECKGTGMRKEESRMAGSVSKRPVGRLWEKIREP